MLSEMRSAGEVKADCQGTEWSGKVKDARGRRLCQKWHRNGPCADLGRVIPRRQRTAPRWDHSTRCFMRNGDRIIRIQIVCGWRQLQSPSELIARESTTVFAADGAIGARCCCIKASGTRRLSSPLSFSPPLPSLGLPLSKRTVSARRRSKDERAKAHKTAAILPFSPIGRTP